jgi:predicted AAA+ superfamily ATPase
MASNDISYSDLAASPEWETLRDWIESEAKTKAEALVSRTFTSLDEVTRLQGEIAGLRRIVQHVYHKVHMECKGK